MYRTTAACAASIATALLLSACGGTGGSAGPADSGSNRPTASASTSSAESVEEPTPEPTPEETSDTLKFGQTQKYEDGLSLTVAAPKPYKPSQYAAVEGKDKYYVQFTVTIVNKTGKPYDPVLFSASVQSANQEGHQVFDTGTGVEGPPETKILNGREAKFRIAFGVANPKDIVLEAAPGFEYDSALFTN